MSEKPPVVVHPAVLRERLDLVADALMTLLAAVGDAPALRAAREQAIGALRAAGYVVPE